MILLVGEQNWHCSGLLIHRVPRPTIGSSPILPVMSIFPVIIISHINNCEIASYFRNECDWRYSKDANMVTGIFNSIEEIANHIVKLDREFYDDAHRYEYYGDFITSIIKSLAKEHDPKYEYSHLIISKESFADENFGISGKNGVLDTPTDWEPREELLQLVIQKKKTATANRLANEEKEKIEKEQKQKQEKEAERERTRLLNEERDRLEYIRLKNKYNT